MASWRPGTVALGVSVPSVEVDTAATAASSLVDPGGAALVAVGVAWGPAGGQAAGGRSVESV
jgi:hypothetical protein